MKGLCVKRSSIGIDVGARSIRAVQIEARRGRRVVTALTVMPRKETGEPLRCDEIAGLRPVLKRQGFHGRDVVIAASDETLLRGAIDLPRQVSGEPAAQIARMELARIHNRVPDSFEMTCWEPVAGQSRSTIQAFAFGCPHEAANALIDTFDNNGLNVGALDVRAIAAVRACAPLILSPPAITALLDVEWNTTQLQIARGPTVVYERFFSNHCFSDLILHLSEKFNLAAASAFQVLSAVGVSGPSATEALDEQSLGVIRRIARSHFDGIVQELRAPFEYVAHRYPSEGVRRILLMGEGAALPGLPPYFSTALGVEVLTASPADIVESSSHLLAKARNPALTVALGLARFSGA